MNDLIGSKWRIWDLHYHTPSSYDVKNGSITNEKIIEELLMRNVSAVAITDHHFIDVSRIRELQKLADDKITIFPGIELRSELGGSESVHYIGIFAPDSEIEHIWTTLQGQLGLTATAITQHGGDDAVYFDFKEGSKAIRSLGGLVSVHAGKKSNSIEKIANATAYKMALKTDLVRDYIDIFEAASADDVDGYRQKVFPVIKLEKPIIVASDKHHRATDIDRVPCWIKADTTFAGLKRILIEPSRVYVGAEPPALSLQRSNKTKYCQSISFEKDEKSTLDEHWFSGEVQLNTGLVAVIGNKGSGKSALADTIGLLGNARREKYFSFLRSDKFRAARGRKAESFYASLSWLSGNTNKQQLSSSVDGTAVETIKYIPQHYLESICNEVSGGEGTEFDKELKSVIFSHVPEEQCLKYSSFSDLIEFKTNETNEHILLLQAKIEALNARYIDLNEKLTPEYMASLERQIKHKEEELETHLKSKPEECKEPESDPEVGKKNSELSNAIDQHRIKIEEYEKVIEGIKTDKAKAVRVKAMAEKLKSKLENLQRKYDEFAAGSFECNEIGVELKDVITFKIDDSKINEIIEKKDLEIKVLFNKLEEDTEGAPAFEKRKLLDEVEDIRKTMDVPNQRYHKYLEDLTAWASKKQEIKGNNETLGTLAYLKKHFDDLKNQLPVDLEDVKNKRTSVVEEIYDEIEKLVQVYASLYSPIESVIAGNPLKGQGLDIGFQVSIAQNNFEERFFQLIQQGRRGSFCGVDEGQARLRKMLRNANYSTKEGVKEFLEEIDKALSYDLREEENASPVKIIDIVKKGNDPVDVYNFIYGLSYLFPRYALTWGGQPLEMLSPGERGALLLVFYLLVDRESIPLVIDQPEENLDNESVYRMIVPCIKQAKERRQVIIVTHNPNLAVVCDADQIIYCSMDKAKGNRIVYTTGAIENPVINGHIINVLEGTRPAFDVRDAKYKLF